MKFKKVADVFDVLEKESSRTALTKVLADLFTRATPDEAAIIAYLSLGSLQASYLGNQFNFAEKSFINAIATLLDSSAAQVKRSLDALGDLGSVVARGFWEPTAGEILTVTDVHTLLVRFISISGQGSQDVKEAKMLKLLRVLDPLSAKYVVRVVLGQLRMGFSDMTLLDAFSWMEAGDKSLRRDLEDAYNVSADIGLIIKTLKKDGIDGIKAIGITPGIPVRPAAAERMADAKAIFEKLGTCVAQPKIDGFRLQVHIDKRHGKHDIHFFSRNLQDMSAMFPEVKAAIAGLPVKTLVAEGEAIAFDPETGIFLPFQETVKRKRKHNVAQVAQEFPLKLFLFDLLYCDGQSLLDVPHAQRREQLCALLAHETKKQERVVAPIEEVTMTSAGQVSDYFQLCIAEGLEGIIVKRTDAVYQPGKRNFNWIKLKREEAGSLDDTLDCVILGYYFGQGKRASFGIGALLVGIFNPDKDCFQTIAKIGTGLTDQEWKEQKKNCDALKVHAQPHNVVCEKALHPDVWVAPQLVCMIRADEITRSPLHSAGASKATLGFALRFPRIMGYRPDKSATDTTTLKELERLYQLQFAKKR